MRTIGFISIAVLLSGATKVLGQETDPRAANEVDAQPIVIVPYANTPTRVLANITSQLEVEHLREGLTEELRFGSEPYWVELRAALSDRGFDVASGEVLARYEMEANADFIWVRDAHRQQFNLTYRFFEQSGKGQVVSWMEYPPDGRGSTQ